MAEGYINIQRINGNYIIKYALAQRQNGIKSAGSSVGIGANPAELEEYILSFLNKSFENKIILKSTIPLNKEFKERYSRISKEELEQIKNFLSTKRKDISFRLSA